VIHRRHVFHIAGYDPVSPDQYYRRFLRQLQIFTQTWSVEAEASELVIGPSNPSWTVRTEGPNWQVNTVFELFAWDDLVNKDAAGSRIVRLLRAGATYLNLLFTGTLFRYAFANTRYFAFAIVPVLQVLLFATVGWLVVFFLAGSLGLSPILRHALAVIGGFGIMLLLLEWPGRVWRTYQALDDWIFSLDYIYGKRPDLEARLNQFAARLVECVRQGQADEFIVVGHSLGATFAIDALSRALAIDPELGNRGAFSIVTVGATIPKCGLHPAAHELRDRIGKVVREKPIHWIEYQSRADAISFYRCNPATMARIRGKSDLLDSKPVVRRLQIKDMLRSETYKKYRLRVLRVHYQFVSANDRRAPYDYFMMICGPIAVRTWTTSRLGLLDFFGTENAVVVDSVR
jgi:pimeloyl-ACP methyl ester carboxylesterase